ncbi:MAG TPA: GNAT family N-acetyltransferase [Mycobacteriales bacterium]|nr:GNAT family N-acetyltransferase [Mycobacteriales bacterium]
MEPADITAGRLHLRPFRAADADVVLRACQDPDIQRWTSVPSPYLARHARSWVTSVAPAGWSSGRAATFAVLDSTCGDLLASVGLDRISPTERSAELGYWCAPWARGQGVMTQAAAAACRWGFGAPDAGGLGLGLIEWRAEVGNDASRRVAEKVGFRIEGTLRLRAVHQGRRVDCWVGSLLLEEILG